MADRMLPTWRSGSPPPVGQERQGRVQPAVPAHPGGGRTTEVPNGRPILLVPPPRAGSPWPGAEPGARGRAVPGLRGGAGPAGQAGRQAWPGRGHGPQGHVVARSASDASRGGMRGRGPGGPAGARPIAAPSARAGHGQVRPRSSRRCRPGRPGGAGRAVLSGPGRRTLSSGRRRRGVRGSGAC